MVPSNDDEKPSEYEKQLVNRGFQHMAQLVREYGLKIQEIEARREAAIERFRLLTDRFREESHRYDHRRVLLGRDVIAAHITRRAYRLVLCLIGLGEFALNAQAFEVFQKPVILTWLMALAVAVGIPVVAHFCGIWVKQWPKPAWATGLKLAFTAAGTIGCLVGINAARRAYLGLEGIGLGQQDEILEKAFLAINIFVFLAAGVLSYFSHDKDQELEILHKRVSKLDRKLDRIDAEIHRLGGEADRLSISQQAELDEIRGIVRELVGMYRGENILARKTGQKPKSFDIEPVIPEPQFVSERRRATLISEIDQIRQQRLRVQRYLDQPEAPTAGVATDQS